MTNGHVLHPTVFIAHPSDLLTDHLPNGDGLVAHDFLRELAARGYRLHVATRETALHTPFPDNVTLYPIGRRFRQPALDRLAYMLAIRRLLARLRRRERIDLVHQMNPVFAGLSLGLIGCGLPILLGTFVARWPGGEASDAGRGRISTSASAVARWMITFVQQSFASVLLVTTPAALNRIATPALRKKALVLRHGVDAELFAPSTAADRTDEALSILFYAHLDRRKGVFVLVEAFREVLRQVPSCRLILVGRGEHEAELRQVIAASGYADRIEIRNRVPRHEAPALLRQGSVYCLPSFGEPYGMTLLEAMACGCAVVVTDAGGPPHIVPPTGGLVVPTGDATALASALVELLQSPETRRRMGAANRAHVESIHTWRAVVDRLEEIYRATVQSDEPAREDLSASAA